MERCPSCDFPVQDEWHSCRRCGAHLSHDLRTTALPRRMGGRAGVETATRPVVTGPPPLTRAVVATARVRDTMLPHRVGAPGTTDMTPASKPSDTLLPRMAGMRRPATIAALIGAGIAAVRFAGRRHRRH
jgi:hypothetical protein